MFTAVEDEYNRLSNSMWQSSALLFGKGSQLAVTLNGILLDFEQLSAAEITCQASVHP